MKKIFESATTLIYLFAAIILASIALFIMGWSAYEVIEHAMSSQALDKGFISKQLEAVGAVIIAVAILDVSKYMIEEEVLRNKELRSPKEARETLTKIMVIVSIAVSIEALIYIFKAGTEDIKLLIYPGFLMICAILVIVGLGVYQKLSITTEKRNQDRANQNQLN
ncbi:hypothetical protein imdm_882 [gamma proteobacterium IMCC2047]|nr:hypothetical protein imdm_882 [gamma proteobacterium IMCC2047]